MLRCDHLFTDHWALTPWCPLSPRGHNPPQWPVYRDTITCQAQWHAVTLSSQHQSSLIIRVNVYLELILCGELEGDWKWNFLKISRLVKLNQIWPGHKTRTTALLVASDSPSVPDSKFIFMNFPRSREVIETLIRAEIITVTASHIPQYFHFKSPVWLILSVWQIPDYVRGDAIMGLMTIHHTRDVPATLHHRYCHHIQRHKVSTPHHNIATHPSPFLPFPRN